MQIRRRGKPGEQPQLQMTAMIDIVFLLLVFFVMTFQIVLPEGDFLVRMPATASAGPPPEDQLPPLVLQLEADASGELAGIALNDRKFGTNYDALRNMVIELVGHQRGPGSLAQTAEVELVCDPQLHYSHVIAAITATSGYVSDQGARISLVEKFRFRSPAR